MPKKIIEIEALVPCLVDDKHRSKESGSFKVDASLFTDGEGKLKLPKHLVLVGESEISDEELKAEADAKALAEAEEKKALLEEAENLGIKGAGEHWKLETLRSKVEQAKIALQGGTE